MTNSEKAQARAERAQARAQGQKYYFTGHPCKHGHIAKRYTIDAKCVECCIIRKLKDRDNNTKRKRKYREVNREIINKRARERNAAGYERLRKYGLTPDQYKVLLVKQCNRCASCGISFDTLPKLHIHVDHCHRTNIVRGLLCNLCNITIGFAKEDISRLLKCSEYLLEFYQYE